MPAKQLSGFNVAAALALLVAAGAFLALARGELIDSGAIDDGEFYFARLMYADAANSRGRGWRGAAVNYVVYAMTH